MEPSWARIPVPISDERDRRELCAILASNGLEVRVVRERLTARGTVKRYIEYRSAVLSSTQKIPE